MWRRCALTVLKKKTIPSISTTTLCNQVHPTRTAVQFLSSKSNSDIVITKTPKHQGQPADVDPTPTPPPKQGGCSGGKSNDERERESVIMHLQNIVREHHKYAQFDDALKSSVELLDLSIDHFGEDHPVTASSYNNVGLMNKMLGNFDASRDMYHKALVTYGDIVGKDHANYAAALSNLGNLSRAQSQLDEELTAIQRLQLNEEAIEYFEEAFQVRTLELGEHHPHTINSQTNLGSALAAQVLSDRITMSKASSRKKNVNLKMSKFTEKRWELAELHLRTALRTAVQNPRGEQITINNNGGVDSSVITPAVLTLSSATAAQNLAVFLKCRADLVSKKEIDNDEMTLDMGDMYAEAKTLYEGAIRVRLELLGETHPETIASKFSFAELVSALGDEDEANKIRKEIMKDYVTEEDEMEPGDEEPLK